MFAAGQKCLIIQHSLSMFFLSSQATLILSEVIFFFFQIQRESFSHFFKKTLFLKRNFRLTEKLSPQYKVTKNIPSPFTVII